jgi:hypothetical protein
MVLPDFMDKHEKKKFYRFRASRCALRPKEISMARRFSVIPVLAVLVAVCVPAHAQVQAQDSPSLGDVARQAKKDKSDKPVAKVFTNDDIGMGSSMPSPAPGQGSSGRVQSAAGKSSAGTIQSSAEGLDRLQAALDHLAALDRKALAADILEGNESNFPGRAAWEEKLFTAKQVFVAETRLVLQKAKQVTASAEGIRDAEDMNDPKVKSVGAKLDQLVQETQRNSAAFQAVAAEGKALASQPAGQ